MSDIDRLIERIIDRSSSLDRGSLIEAGMIERATIAPLATETSVVRAVDSIIGLGPLQGFTDDPMVTDILVNGPSEVWIERSGELERTDVVFRSDDDVVAMVRRVVSRIGLRIDRSSPAVDARLPDGSRLHAVIPPAAVDGPIVAIRRFNNAVRDVDDLVRSKSVGEDGGEILKSLVLDRTNLLIAGATGSGKTTLLNVLCSEIPSGDRIITIEDAAELALPGHVVRLEAHPPNAEGAGEITIRSLLRHALRLRPDRLVVGEVRGTEALDMIQALNTGHAGSMSTVHANGPREALDRIAAMAAMAPERVPPETLVGQVRSAIGAIVLVTRVGGTRGVRSIHIVEEDDLNEVYRC
ncbi:MAG: Flp pilus assembly complex ATPase component TadA [Actinomycetia bacterium]|nr:Flp pilus assembly complex ATPase component TadA [Actinomycetes bacterium]